MPREAGYLNVYKPKDYTSFDCVAILRRVLGIRKIGHTGTLDPMAEGVLVLCVGSATRTIEYLERDTKEYAGSLRLGVTSDTDDIWGTVLSETKDVSVTREELEAALDRYRGDIDQVPPAYAAVKVDGKKLYQYAREGKEVTVAPRRVTIHEAEITAFDGQNADFRIVCSKGTYIRSICRDIGRDLGTGGVMTALTRTRNGIFRAEDGVSIEDFKTMERDEALAHLLPIDRGLQGFRALCGTEEEGLALMQGKRVSAEPHRGELEMDLHNELFRYYINDPEDPASFVGVVRWDRQEDCLKADKILRQL